MRRKRMIDVNVGASGVMSLRTGVMASESTSNRRVPRPVKKVTGWWGRDRALGSVIKDETPHSQAMGARQAMWTRTFRTTTSAASSVIVSSHAPQKLLTQIHPGVEAGDLIGIAVEHERGLALFPDGAPMRRSVFWLQRGWSTLGFTFE